MFRSNALEREVGLNLREVTYNGVILFELNASAKGMKWCYTVVAIRNLKRKGME